MDKLEIDIRNPFLDFFRTSVLFWGQTGAQNLVWFFRQDGCCKRGGSGYMVVDLQVGGVFALPRFIFFVTAHGPHCFKFLAVLNNTRYVTTRTAGAVSMMPV